MNNQAQSGDLNDYFKEVLSEMGFGPEQLKDLSMGERLELVKGLHDIQRTWDKDLPLADQDESKRKQIYDHYQPIIQEHFKKFKIAPQGENLREVGKPLQVSPQIQTAVKGVNSALNDIKANDPQQEQSPVLEVPKPLIEKEPEGATPLYDEWAKNANANPLQLGLPGSPALPKAPTPVLDQFEQQMQNKADPRIEALKRLRM